MSLTGLTSRSDGYLSATAGPHAAPAMPLSRRGRDASGHGDPVAPQPGRTPAAMVERTPFTNEPESSVEYVFANSTASSMITAFGGPAASSSSATASRNTSRSMTAMRSSGHPTEAAAIRSSASAQVASAPLSSV